MIYKTIGYCETIGSDRLTQYVSSDEAARTAPLLLLHLLPPPLPRRCSFFFIFFLLHLVVSTVDVQERKIRLVAAIVVEERESLACDYYELPSYLKPCFLYFGLFPIGSSVGKIKIIRLWIAEVFFVQYSSNNLTLEDVAEEYLNELILRNLVEVQDKDPIGKS